MTSNAILRKESKSSFITAKSQEKLDESQKPSHLNDFMKKDSKSKLVSFVLPPKESTPFENDQPTLSKIEKFDLPKNKPEDLAESEKKVKKVTLFKIGEQQNSKTEIAPLKKNEVFEDESKSFADFINVSSGDFTSSLKSSDFKKI